MLGLWGLPVEIVHAVGWHHSPQSAMEREFSILSAVHAGNVLSRTGNKAKPAASLKADFDLPYLREIGSEFSRNQWRELCGFKRDPADDAPAQGNTERILARAV